MGKNPLKEALYALNDLPPVSRAISLRFETLTAITVAEIRAIKVQAYKALMQVVQDPKYYEYEDAEQLNKGIKRMVKNLKLSQDKQARIWLLGELMRYDAHLFPLNKLTQEGKEEFEGINKALSEFVFALTDVANKYDE